ncbi:hypothetical protein G6F62_003684 [Rhizopus arrhizus]|nr:hypothetical protein G6F23_000151 [Rhizopus arrhizus]KAG0768292.1 hypothetical protein G6F24_002070 [Rhizopus arrhizus]KAG0794441.1 hypothetical protein G6F21_002868 [Rhizopus arrhizus]KAG0802320.1 hypothetical protein G6F22_000376 [Rhizopus arrhizus]KAG0815753.1 hypothetical protein G6F20_003752 [Rhizopus arrhizus]
MSANSTSNSQKLRLNFHYFDQECDFGIETEDGQRIRKKKTPGRKPNPPTTEEKRAQNRASQRAYRLRESQRKQEFEREKQHLVEEINNLKRKLTQSKYEADYLRAIVLHLTLNSLAQKGSVPYAWADDDDSLPNMTGDQFFTNKESTWECPPLLRVILEKGRIVDLGKAMCNTFQVNESICSGKKFIKDLTSYGVCISDESIYLNKNSQELERNFSIQPERMVPQETTKCTSENKQDSAPLTISTHEGGEAELEEIIPTNDNQLLAYKKPLRGVLLTTPSLKTADDFIDMPPLQALHVLRLQLKLCSILGVSINATLIPTTLQKIVPHDIRIDYVPDDSIRDRMILYQDYYDVDECFECLTKNTIFMGGDIRIIKNWSLQTPEYSSKFWFFSHEFIDQSNTYHFINPIDVINQEYSENDDCTESNSSQYSNTNACNGFRTTSPIVPNLQWTSGQCYQVSYDLGLNTAGISDVTVDLYDAQTNTSVNTLVLNEPTTSLGTTKPFNLNASKSGRYYYLVTFSNQGCAPMKTVTFQVNYNPNSSPAVCE